MARSLVLAHRQPARRMTAMRRGLLYGGAFASALWLAGCAVDVANTAPARELAQLSQPPGSVYRGWRVFQDKCASCHGPAATGMASGGPDLLVSVGQMGPRRFVSIVLDRYDWVPPAAQAGGESPGREVLVERILQRKEDALTMPAWKDEPSVSAHVADLYAYLAARADGTQGPGRPAP